MNKITVLIGDLFESHAQTLTNTVNTVGVMGKGIALQFKKRYPNMYNDYLHRCDQKSVKIGEPYLFKGSLFDKWVLNFPTKEHWRSPSRLDAIQKGLKHIQVNYEEWGIESLAVPPLGCGEGNLEWRIVGPTLYRGLAELDIPIDLYAPFGTPHEELRIEFLDKSEFPQEQPLSRIPAAGVALATILERIVSKRYHYPIGRIGMQKIAYFATRAGIETGLQFERRSYGPHATGLKKVIANLINNGLIEEHRRGQMFVNKPGPTLADGQLVFKTELIGWEKEINQVVDLFRRLPSSRWAELVASVDYIAELLMNNNQARGAGPVQEQRVIEEVERWKKGRKPPPSRDDIISATRTLSFLRWIDIYPAEEEDEMVGV